MKLLSKSLIIVLTVAKLVEASQLNDEEILREWQQAGGEVPLEFNQKAESANTDESINEPRWKHQSSSAVQAYTRTAEGANLTNPHNDGQFYKIERADNLKYELSADESLFIDTKFTYGEDRAHQKVNLLINNVLLSYKSKWFQFDVGDVATDFSSLSTSVAHRGAQIQVDNSLIQIRLATGTIVPSWHELTNQQLRTQYLRQLTAGALEFKLYKGLLFYITQQSASDVETSFTPVGSSFANSSISSSFGFDYKNSWLQFEIEAAESKLKQLNTTDKKDTAYVADLSLNSEFTTSKLGVHYYGPYFSTPSGKVVSGLAEQYANLSFRKPYSFNSQIEFRKTENLLVNLIDEKRSTPTNSYSAGIGYEFKNDWRVNLNAAQSKTDLEASKRSLNSMQSMSVYRNQENLNLSLSFSQSYYRNDYSSASDSKTDSATLVINPVLGKSNEDAGKVFYDFNFSTRMQNQKFESTSLENKNLGNGLSIRSGVNNSWDLQLSYYSSVFDSTTGAELKSNSTQLDYNTSFFNKQLKTRLYFINEVNNSGNVALENKTQTFGFHVLMPY